MAQATYTPIQLYYSTTAAAVPTSGNLVAGELALNTVDEKLYFKNSAGTVKLLASNATSAPVLSFQTSLSGLTPSTATTGVITLAGTLGTSSGGTNLTSFTSGGAVYASSTSVLTTGTLPVASGGTGLTAGTSGGILAYTATGTLASSGALTQYGVVLGGGAGAAPTSTSAGTATYVLTSNGAGVAPTFQAPAASGISTGKAIAMAMIFGF